MFEAKCARCKKVFNPTDDRDLIHIETSTGIQCGGLGTITADWGRDAQRQDR